MEVLDSIINFTRQRDRESLEASLVMALGELIAADTIRFLRCHDRPGGSTLSLSVSYDGAIHGLQDIPDWEIPLSAKPAYQQCCQTKTPVSTSPIQSEDNCLVYPIINHQSQPIALLEIYGPGLSDNDDRLLSALLKIYINYLVLIEESTRDTLTGLLNRKTFDNSLHQLLQDRDSSAAQPDSIVNRRKPQENTQHWLAVADIDHFKGINDTYGHLFGDEVLVLITRIMRETFRSTDKLFRFGGEEFVALISTETISNAKAAFERFRREVEAYRFPQLGRVTVSLGFVKVDRQDMPATVVGHADKALYHAKKHGRNQVCCYDELLASGMLQAETAIDNSDVELF